MINSSQASLLQVSSQLRHCHCYFLLAEHRSRSKHLLRICQRVLSYCFINWTRQYYLTLTGITQDIVTISKLSPLLLIPLFHYQIIRYCIVITSRAIASSHHFVYQTCSNPTHPSCHASSVASAPSTEAKFTWEFYKSNFEKIGYLGSLTYLCIWFYVIAH